jgi:hypothetical protein
MLRASLRARAKVLSIATLVACGGSSVGDGAPSAVPGLAIETGDFTAAPGDSFECFYTDRITASELSVTGATAQQQTGGHHVAVYYADQVQPVGHHACVDAEMVAWHQIAADAGNKEGVIDLPPGYATKVPAGKQIVVQSHYVNTSGAARTVHDAITITLADPANVKAYANAFVVSNGAFTVPPRATASSVAECTTPQDLKLLLLLGHMHERGVHFRLEQLDAQGGVASTLYDTDWSLEYVSHPPVTRFDPAAPLTLAAGAHLRQTCTWENAGDDALAFPQEMCVAFSYYVPDAGFLNCSGMQVTSAP